MCGPRVGVEAPAERPTNSLGRGASHARLVPVNSLARRLRQGPGRPRLKREVTDNSHGERETRTDRIAGAMANLGYVIPIRRVGNVLRRNGLAPAPAQRESTPFTRES
jgi:hypothetical protein